MQFPCLCSFVGASVDVRPPPAASRLVPLSGGTVFRGPPSERPPPFFGGAGVLFLHLLLQDLRERLPLVDDAVDCAPVRKAAQVAVIDEEVRLQLAAVVAVFLRVLLREVLVHGIKLHAALAAPFHRLVQEASFAHGPQDELVAVLDELFQGLDGKRLFAAYFRVTVLHDGAVEVDSYDHIPIYIMISGGEVMKKSGYGEGGNVKIAFPDDFFSLICFFVRKISVLLLLH